jgi:kynurenine formamidase
MPVNLPDETRRIIDLSIMIEDAQSAPVRHQPKIAYTDHDKSLEENWLAPGLPKEAWLEGKGWASEIVTLSTHSGTHMDAPWHYHPTMNKSLESGIERAATIDEVPLGWCMHRGVKLDFRRFPAGYVSSGADIEAELKRIGHTLSPLDIVLVNTRAAALYGTDEYWQSQCGMGREATLYLLERGVRVVGTDAWSWDVAMPYMRAAWERTHSPLIMAEGHKAGAEIGYYQMEKLTNLDLLPANGFAVICLPMKIKAASAGWTRAIAILD